MNLDMNTIKTEIALIKQSCEFTQQRINNIELKIKNFITKDEFQLVRGIVFGLVSIIVITVIGALLAQVIVD